MKSDTTAVPDLKETWYVYGPGGRHYYTAKLVQTLSNYKILVKAFINIIDNAAKKKSCTKISFSPLPYM